MKKLKKWQVGVFHENNYYHGGYFASENVATLAAEKLYQDLTRPKPDFTLETNTAGEATEKGAHTPTISPPEDAQEVKPTVSLPEVMDAPQRANKKVRERKKKSPNTEIFKRLKKNIVKIKLTKTKKMLRKENFQTPKVKINFIKTKKMLRKENYQTKLPRLNESGYENVVWKPSHNKYVGSFKKYYQTYRTHYHSDPKECFEELQQIREQVEAGTYVKPTRAGMSNNTSGCSGVSWKTSKKRWVVYFNIEGKQCYFGSYRDKEDAVSVAKQVMRELKHGQEDDKTRAGQTKEGSEAQT